MCLAHSLLFSLTSCKISVVIHGGLSAVRDSLRGTCVSTSSSMLPFSSCHASSQFRPSISPAQSLSLSSSLIPVQFAFLQFLTLSFLFPASPAMSSSMSNTSWSLLPSRPADMSETSLSGLSVSTRSSMLPLMCVADSTSCSRPLSVQASRNLLPLPVVAVLFCQSISG